MARKTPAKVPARTADPAKAKRVSRRTTPSPETLAALGLDRLAALVLAEAADNPAFRKRVTAAIAGLQGPDAVAALVDRRLTALERATGYIDWQKRRAFAADLDATVSTIATTLQPLDAVAALDRLIRFLAGAEAVLGRVDDSHGHVHAVYERAAEAVVAIAGALPPDAAERFALRLVPLLDADAFGLLEALLLGLIPGLPPAALAPLDAALAAATPASGNDRRGTLKAIRLVRMRQAVADRRGDVDAYIALESARAPEGVDTVAVAERLLADGRAREALAWIQRPPPRGARFVTRAQMLTGAFDTDVPDRARIALEIRIREALGERAAAQDLRWRRYAETLDRDMLRDFIARLPDFEDEEALERAFDHAAAYRPIERALNFFIHWPKLDRAARLVLDHAAAWDGDRYEVLAPAALALEDLHPVAASVLYRRLLDHILGHARASAYGHGARHLASLDALAGRIEPGRLAPDPQAYREALRRTHGRKHGFWGRVEG